MSEQKEWKDLHIEIQSKVLALLEGLTLHQINIILSQVQDVVKSHAVYR